MTNIYYKSDFKLIETHEDLSVPFSFEYRTTNGNSYTASFDGSTYTNCKLEDGHLVIIFDSHDIGVGNLSVVRKWFLTDQDFKDGIFHKITKDYLDVRLTADASDNYEVDVSVAPSWSKGDPFPYEQLTAAEYSALTEYEDKLYIVTDE